MSKVSREIVVVDRDYKLHDLPDGDLMEDIWKVCKSHNLSDKGLFKVQIIYQEVEGE